MIGLVITKLKNGELTSAITRRVVLALQRTRLKLFSSPINEWQDIPVIINNRNRYTYLLTLIDWLEKVGVKNIYILDNDSTYPLLLEYYKTTNHTVLYLNRNIGKTALWATEAYHKVFRHNYFIYTDPDVVPDKGCPDDAIGFLWEKLKQYQTETDKVGFGLKIDDLPDHFKLKEQVTNWEAQFWEKPVDNDVFDAAIDTTFAVYRPYALHSEVSGYRTAEPYILKHLPWYLDYDNLSEEEEYYLKRAVVSSTIGMVANNETNYPANRQDGQSDKQLSRFKL